MNILERRRQIASDYKAARINANGIFDNIISLTGNYATADSIYYAILNELDSAYDSAMESVLDELTYREYALTQYRDSDISNPTQQESDSNE